MCDGARGEAEGSIPREHVGSSRADAELTRPRAGIQVEGKLGLETACAPGEGFF